MKTSFDVINILFSHIKNSELVTGAFKVNGGVYKLQRPLNSDKEDIVINALPFNREDLQEGVFNVNIFVKNLSITVSGGLTDNSQPNTSRITKLVQIASEVFSETWADDGSYTFELQQEQVFTDENNQHYINLRIEFQNIKI